MSSVSTEPAESLSSQAGTIATPSLVPGLPAGAPQTAWRLSSFAGRLGEICSGRTSAALTLAFRLVLDAQRCNEPVAWVTHRNRAFFPPDAADAAVDVEALVVVWAADALQSARAADQLVRSGGFGLVVLDLGRAPRLPLSVLGRLVGLARKHQAAVLCLTEEHGGRSGLGSLVSIRAQASRWQQQDNRYRCQARILKDKRRGPSWEHTEICRGPDGLY